MDIREAERSDLPGLLDLYTHLNAESIPDIGAHIENIWDEILSDRNHYILLGTENGVLISSCVLIIVRNLTRGQRPYALVENVVTRAECRNRGFATTLLDRAKELAVSENCYKIMLMSGSKREETLRFYENAGYNRTDKTAFIQWL